MYALVLTLALAAALLAAGSGNVLTYCHTDTECESILVTGGNP